MGTRVKCPSCNKVMIVRDGGEMPQFCPRCGGNIGQNDPSCGGSAPDRIGCPECGRALDVSGRTAGTAVPCPCGAHLRLPDESVARSGLHRASAVAQSRYEIATSDGQRYGPVQAGVLERWAVERRLLPEDHVQRIKPDGSRDSMLLASDHPDLVGIFDAVPSKDQVPGTPRYQVGPWLRRIAFGTLGIAAATVVRSAAQQGASASAVAGSAAAGSQPVPITPDAPATEGIPGTLPEVPPAQLPALVDEKIQDLSKLPDWLSPTPAPSPEGAQPPDVVSGQGQAEPAPSTIARPGPGPSPSGETGGVEQPAAESAAGPAAPTPGHGPSAAVSESPPQPASDQQIPLGNSEAGEPPSLPPQTPGQELPAGQLSRTVEPYTAQPFEQVEVGSTSLLPSELGGTPPPGLQMPPAQIRIDPGDLDVSGTTSSGQLGLDVLDFSEDELQQGARYYEMDQPRPPEPTAEGRQEPRFHETLGETNVADEDAFNVPRSEHTSNGQSRPNISGGGGAGSGSAGSGAMGAGGGLSGLAKLLKLLLIAIFIGGTGTAGFYAVRHFDLLGGILGDSPSAVVREYHRRLEQGRDVSGLLSAESRKVFAELYGDDQDLVAGLRAKARADAKYYRWHISSERIDGDRAWVMVVTETDNPIEAYLASMREEMNVKNAYNRRQGNDSLIRLNEAFYEQKKRELQTPLARQMAEQLKRQEMPVLCVREGGRWKVAPAEQMDAAFENIDKMIDRMFENLDE